MDYTKHGLDTFFERQAAGIHQNRIVSPLERCDRACSIQSVTFCHVSQNLCQFNWLSLFFEPGRNGFPMTTRAWVRNPFFSVI